MLTPELNAVCLEQRDRDTMADFAATLFHGWPSLYLGGREREAPGLRDRVSLAILVTAPCWVAIGES